MSKKRLSGLFMGAALAAIFSFAGASGCSDDTEQLFVGNNCQEACNRYAACYNASFDTVSCNSRCENSINTSVITVQTTDDCLNCIGDNTCLSATYNCASTCGLIITVP